MILNIGHRGFGVHTIENTITAFKKAIDSKLDMIEFDVRLTSDDEPIIFHDRSLIRLGSVGLKVEDLDLESIKKLYIFSKKRGNKELAYEKIPSLKEVLELTQNKIDLNIELKSNNKNKYPILVKKVVDLIKVYDITSKVIVSSFNTDILDLVSKANSEIRCGYLFHRKINVKSIFKKDFNLFSIHPYKHLVRKKLIRRAKEHSVKVIPWTVNSTKLMRKFTKLNIYGVITNYPLKLSNIILENELDSK